jgi:KDO2-lipid IV(A) lauroyltransferase
MAQSLAMQALLKSLSYLPLSALHTLATVVAKLLYLIKPDFIRVIDINLQRCLPDLDPAARQKWVKANVIETVKTFFELAAIWYWPVAKVLAQVKYIDNETLLQQALQKNTGVILLSPHLGAWELAGLYFGQRLSLISLYKPPKLAALEPMIKQARQRSRGRLVPTNAQGIRQIFSALRQGQCVGLLPDQAPKDNGVFAPFFHQPASTMTLVGKLARKTGATVLFAFMQRLPNSQGFRLRYQSVDADINAADLAQAAGALNRGLESCIAQCPKQYLWAYKRFKHSPQGQRDCYQKPLKIYGLRQWPTAIALGLLWTITRLPYRGQRAVGRVLGDMAYHLARRRRVIAQTNIALCFPEKTAAEQADLLKKHFQSLGMGLIEIALAWWGSDQKLAGLGKIEGLAHLHTALAQGHGVILLSAHLNAMELGLRCLTQQVKIHISYRPHENPLIEHHMQRSRNFHAEQAIARDNVRQMVRSLKHNKPLWFAADQNFGHKGHVFAPFFNILAATNTAASRLAKIAGCPVLPFIVQRHEAGYRVRLLPPLADFSGDLQADASAMNRMIETAVAETPEQYLWVHRRFKDRPNGEARLY